MNDKLFQRYLDTNELFTKQMSDQLDNIASLQSSTNDLISDFSKLAEKKISNPGTTDTTNPGTTELVSKIDDLIKELKGENSKKSSDKKSLDSSSLSKQKSSDKKSFDSSSLSKLGSDILSFSKDITTSTPYLLVAKSTIPFTTNTIANFVNQLSEKIQVDDTKLEATSHFIDTILGGIHDFAKGLAKSIPYFMIARPFMGFITNSIASFIISFNDKLKSIKSEDIQNSAITLSDISSAISQFSKQMVLSIPLLIALTPMAALFNLISAPIFKFVSSFAENKDEITDATSSMNRVSLSLVAFAAGIAGSVLILGGTSLGDYANIGMMLLAMTGVAMLYSFIGNGTTGDNIKKGATGITFMSLSIVAFAGSLVISTMLLTKGVSYDDIGEAVKTLGLTAGVYALAGLAWKKISLGALAVTAMSLSMLIFAYPLKTLGEAISSNDKMLWQIPLMLGSIAGIYGLVGGIASTGIGAVAIGLGVIAFIAIGGSLWVISKAVKTWSEIPAMSKEQANGITFTIKSMVYSISHAMDSISLWDKAKLLPKIALLTAVSVPLSTLASGIKSFVNASEGWTKNSGIKLRSILKSLGDSYSYVGNLGSESIEFGINSTMKMGRNLKKLADGILAWSKIDSGLTELAKNNAKSLLEALPKVFVEAYQKGGKSNFWGNNDLTRGVKATMKMGRNLKNLADGILAYRNINSDDLDKAKKSALDILEALPKVFVKAYQSGGKSNFWGNNDLTRGVKATIGMGKAVTSIGNFIRSVRDIDEKDLINVKSVITNVIGTIVGSIRVYTTKEDSMLSSLQKQLEKIYIKFKDFNKELKNNSAIIAKLDVKNLEKWVTSLEKLSNIDNTKLEKVNNSYNRNQSLGNTLAQVAGDATSGLVNTGKKVINKIGSIFGGEEKEQTKSTTQSGEEKEQTKSTTQKQTTASTSQPTTQSNPVIQNQQSDIMLQQLLQQLAILTQLLSSAIQGGVMKVENVDSNLNNMFIRK